MSYDGVTHSGGSVLTKVAPGSFSLTVNGVHRRSLRADGTFGYWHTIYSTSPVTTTFSAGTHTVTAGTMVLTHNILKYTATSTLTNLQFAQTCCYPVGGTNSIALTGSVTSTITLDWTAGATTCGNVSINGVATTLPACEPGA